MIVQSHANRCQQGTVRTFLKRAPVNRRDKCEYKAHYKYVLSSYLELSEAKAAI